MSIYNRYPTFSSKADHTLAALKITVGASGAVASYSGTPGFTAAKNASTGVYDITFPPVPGIAPVGQPALKSAAGTVQQVFYVAIAATGTAQIQTDNGGGTATNPASGDEIYLHFDVQLSGVD